MPPADNTPDFDKMTPEEIMTWMESLAKKQGASEGFTTSADMQIADIDPSSVVIDEPGYVPSEGKMKGKKIETIVSSKPAPAPQAEPPSPPPQETFAPPPVEQPAAVLTPEPESVAQGSMSWLESLAADQGVEFPSLDLSSVAAELAPAEPAAPATNPVDWLESLAQSEGVVTDATPATSAGADDSMAWLESLAKRQGANDDELMTEANLDVPLPEATQVDGPGYTDYSFDMPGTPGKIGTGEHSAVSAEPSKELEPAALEDPSAWLDSLASGEGFEAGSPAADEAPAPAAAKMDDAEIQAALARGEVVPHDQMEAWMNRQLEIGAQRSEPEELSAYDPDAPAVPADLPDWLLDQVGQAPPVDDVPQAAPVSEPPPLLDAIFEPPAVVDMPDWLKDEPESSELDSIFANTLEQDAPVIPPPPQETFAPPPAPEPVVAQAAPTGVDTNDPWVEAFEIEYKERQGDTSPTPTPATAAAAFLELQDADLEPETELPLGEPEAVPDWLQGMVTGDEAPAVPADIPDWLKQDVTIAQPEPAAASAGVPDWLQTVDVEPTDIPDWLKSTLGTSEQVVVAPEPAPTAVTPSTPPAAVVPAPAARGYSPAPVPIQATQIDVAATLNEARSKANINDIDSSLQNYEQLIRANVELDAVIADVSKLVEKFKTTPAVYRVLGDGLMRQGKLQAALDTYRKALNQL